MSPVQHVRMRRRDEGRSHRQRARGEQGRPGADSPQLGRVLHGRCGHGRVARRPRRRTRGGAGRRGEDGGARDRGHSPSGAASEAERRPFYRRMSLPSCGRRRVNGVPVQSPCSVSRDQSPPNPSKTTFWKGRDIPPWARGTGRSRKIWLDIPPHIGSPTNRVLHSRWQTPRNFAWRSWGLRIESPRFCVYDLDIRQVR